MSPAGDALVVTADLDVHVVAPDGRTARVRFTDSAGTLVVDVQHPRVLLASLPRGSVGAVRPLLRFGSDVVARVREATGARWAQPVELRLDGRVVLSGSGTGWRAGPGLLRPAAVAAAAVAVLFTAVVTGVSVARRSRSSG